MRKTEQSIKIKASPEKVWARMRDFHDMSWAPNVITKCTPVGDHRGDQIGAKRILNEAFHETLVELDDGNRTMRYTIDEGPSPISAKEIAGYEGVVRVTDGGEGTTRVDWNSSWKSGSEDEVHDFCHPIYVALLDDMKASLE